MRDFGKQKSGKIKTQIVKNAIFSGELESYETKYVILVQFSAGGINMICFYKGGEGNRI